MEKKGAYRCEKDIHPELRMYKGGNKNFHVLRQRHVRWCVQPLERETGHRNSPHVAASQKE